MRSARRRRLPPVPIERIADRGRARTRRSFLTAIAAQRERITAPEDALTEAADLRPMVSALAKLYWAAGQLAGQQLRAALQPAKAKPAVRPSLGLDFTAANPEAVAWFERYGARLITNIGAEAREAVKRVIAAAIAEGGHPRDVARLIRWHVGLTLAQAKAALDYREELIAAGTTGERLATLTQRYTEKLLKARAERIARTETIAAVNGGQQQLWLQAKDEGLLSPDAEREWIATEVDACPICEALDGTTTGLDEPFEGDLDTPPAHPNCRCAIGLRL